MLYQLPKPTKTISSAYATTDSDNGYRIICNSSYPLAITLHSATGRYDFELEIDNIGAGAVTCGGQTILQNSHAHVGNNGGTAWATVIGGGSLTLGESSDMAYRGDRGKTAYDHSQAAHAPSDAQKNSDITKAEIEAELTGTITTHGHNGLSPTGGTTGQVLKKASATDYDLAWGDSAAATNGIPSGGNAGQVLAKVDGTDYNAQWVTPSGGSAIDSDWGQL